MELIERLRADAESTDDIGLSSDAADEIEKLRMALENCRLLAARNRKESWALLILGFCAEGGVVGSVTR